MNTICEVAPAGVVTTLVGLARNPGTANGTGSGTQFYSPSGVVVDSAGNLYAGDTNNHTIRKLTPSGLVTTLARLAGSRLLGEHGSIMARHGCSGKSGRRPLPRSRFTG